MNKKNNGAQLVPYNLEAEQKTLGSLMRDQEAFAEVAEMLPVEAFYEPRHQKVYRALSAMYERGAVVDLLLISDELERRGELEQIGGGYYLAELAQSVISSANVKHWVGIIIERYRRRRLIRFFEERIRELNDGGVDVEQLLSDTLTALVRLDSHKLGSGYVHYKELAPKALADLEARMERSKKGDMYMGDVTTGLTELDQITGGLNRGELFIIAARPSVGKTAFALRIAENVARQGQTVLIYSVEMGAQRVAERMWYGQADVSMSEVRRGKVKSEGVARFMRVLNDTTPHPVYIDGSPQVTIESVLHGCQRLKVDCGVDVVIIDYAQLVRTKKQFGYKRNEELEELTRGFKMLAQSMDCVVIVLSQLTREFIKLVEGGNKKPDVLLGTLRGSGGFEQDADALLFLLRPDKEKEEYDEEHVIRDGIVAKNRDGRTGECHFYFRKRMMRFLNRSEIGVGF